MGSVEHLQGNHRGTSLYYRLNVILWKECRLQIDNTDSNRCNASIHNRNVMNNAKHSYWINKWIKSPTWINLHSEGRKSDAEKLNFRSSWPSNEHPRTMECQYKEKSEAKSLNFSGKKCAKWRNWILLGQKTNIHQFKDLQKDKNANAQKFDT